MFQCKMAAQVGIEGDITPVLRTLAHLGVPQDLPPADNKVPWFMATKGSDKCIELFWGKIGRCWWFVVWRPDRFSNHLTTFGLMRNYALQGGRGRVKGLQELWSSVHQWRSTVIRVDFPSCQFMLFFWTSQSPSDLLLVNFLWLAFRPSERPLPGACMRINGILSLQMAAIVVSMTSLGWMGEWLFRDHMCETPIYCIETCHVWISWFETNAMKFIRLYDYVSYSLDCKPPDI